MKKVIIVLCLFLFVTQASARIIVLERKADPNGNTLTVYCINGYEFVSISAPSANGHNNSMIQVYEQTETGKVTPKRCGK